MAWLQRAFRNLAIWFMAKIQSTSPISLFKVSPSINASLFSLEFSSLKIYKLSYLGWRRAYIQCWAFNLF